MNDRRLSWRAALVWLALIAAALVGWIFYRMETLPARSARQISEGFSEVLHLRPKVTIQDRVIFEQSQSVIELAVVTRPTQVERESEFEWLGSKKKIKLRGLYQVKAGFDLSQPFTVRIEGRRVLVDLPPARILSVDGQDLEVLALQNGIWNKISPADVEAEMRALPMLARQKATDSGLQKEALEMLSSRLREKFGTEYELEIRSGAPPGKE